MNDTEPSYQITLLTIHHNITQPTVGPTYVHCTVMKHKRRGHGFCVCYHCSYVCMLAALCLTAVHYDRRLSYRILFVCM